MSEDIISQLKKTFLFRGLPDDVLAALAQRVSSRTLAPGDVLMRQAETGDSLFVIDEGWFNIVRSDGEGSSLVINKTGPGETLGEMGLLDEAPRSATVVATTNARVMELKKDAFQDILNRRPDVALSLIRGFSTRLRFSTTYVQKAIDWSQKIAQGDYSFIESTGPVAEGSGTDEDKAAQLLSAFFQMVRSVKAREDELKHQLEILTLEIDDSRRKQEFEDLTSTDFYANLKEQAKKLRAQRSSNDKKP
jgi:CRP-like cAMP-binding protein